METIDIEMLGCKFCGSERIVKNGMRNSRQYWLCRNCSNGFVHNKALPRMTYSIDAVAKVVHDYYAGVSLRKIREGIAQKWNSYPTDSSIYFWVKKLTRIGLIETNKQMPRVGDKWLVNEKVIKLKGGKKYWLINIIDKDTRFLLVSRLSATCNMEDIQAVFEIARKKANKSPKWILVDGQWSCEDAIERIFGADTEYTETKSLYSKDLVSTTFECWYEVLKNRLKPLDGMDKSETTQLILEGLVLYYNYLRPHERLADRTPAEIAKTEYPYSSWFEIIKTVKLATSWPMGARS